MYGFPQAGLLAQEQRLEILRDYGYYQRKTGARAVAPQYKANHLHTCFRQVWSKIHQQKGCRTLNERDQEVLYYHSGLERQMLHRNAHEIRLQGKTSSHGHAWIWSKSTQGISP